MNSDTAIPAIETTYSGIRFRSRLEARFAVFFDVLGLPYNYEPDKYQTQHGRYIPDFFIPGIEDGVFIEVKGSYPDEEALGKADVLEEITGKYVYVFYGSEFKTGLHNNGERRARAFFCQCPLCGAISIAGECNRKYGIIEWVHNSTNHACRRFDFLIPRRS